MAGMRHLGEEMTRHNKLWVVAFWAGAALSWVGGAVFVWILYAL